MSRLMRNFSILFLLLIPVAFVRAGTPPLLGKAVEHWLGERDNWAFTLLVREFSGGAVKEERSERYDPSKPGIARWELLAVDGKPPTEERRAEWQKRKTKKRKNPGKPIADYLAFDEATIVKATSATVSYHVPLRNNNSWLFPVEKVELQVTVNRSTLAIQDIGARIDEPFRVALGLARVLDVDFDMQMNSAENERPPDPAEAKPDGTAKVVVNKLGERIEYAWSDFKRVTPHPDNVIASAPAKSAK
jgi:hypothetical protein